jgi:DNA-binding SARP family transcriptional activator
MEFRLLGAFEIWDGGQPVEIAGAKRRALLALLVLRANEVVRSERLIDELWGEHPPGNAAAALQNHVSRLRKTLGADTIASREWGYVLRAAPEEIDLHRFEGLLAEAEQLAASERASKLAEALALWRGPPLADLANESALQRDIGRLEELRLNTVERRIDADLEAGNHSGLVGELEALIAEHPLREHLRWQLILALYRADRQAEALEVYRETRRVLTEELGLEPSPALKELEQAILRHDPSLDARTSPARSEPPPETEQPRRRRIPILPILALLALGLAGTGTSIALVNQQHTVSEPPPTQPPLLLPSVVPDSSSVTDGSPATSDGSASTRSGSTTKRGHTTSKRGNGRSTTKPPPTGGNGSSTTTTSRKILAAWKKDEIGVGLFGWGQVRYGGTLANCQAGECTNGRRSILCSGLLCRFEPRFVITAKEPYAGWKFGGWVGACTGKNPRCVIDFSRVQPSRIGVRYTWIHATFIAVGAGITRANPVQIGKTGTVGDFRVTVNSVQPNVQLNPGPPPPPGAEYFGAKLTMTYTGGGSGTISGGDARVIGNHDNPDSPYTMPQDTCPDQWPWSVKRLDTPVTLYSGQSVSGYLCWEVAKNDATSLDLYFGSGSISRPGTTWFALHS